MKLGRYELRSRTGIGEGTGTNSGPSRSPPTAMIRAETADIDAFVDIGSTKDSDGAIDVNLLNDIGTGGDGSQGRAIGIAVDDENFVTDSVVVEEAAQVLATEVLINDSLTALAEKLEVSSQRDGEYHVALKGKCTRRGVEGAMDSGAYGVTSSGKAGVDDGDSVCIVLGPDRVQESAQNVLNGLMEAFIDSVGLRVGYSGRDILDAIDGKDMLEWVGSELVALIVDATDWMRIAGKPFVLELHGNMSRGHVVDADNLGQSGDWIDAGESKELEVVAMDSDGPGSNEVDGDFIPWLSRKVFGWELATGNTR